MRAPHYGKEVASASMRYYRCVAIGLKFNRARGSIPFILAGRAERSLILKDLTSRYT